MKPKTCHINFEFLLQKSLYRDLMQLCFQQEISNRDLYRLLLLMRNLYDFWRRERKWRQKDWN